MTLGECTMSDTTASVLAVSLDKTFAQRGALGRRKRTLDIAIAVALLLLLIPLLLTIAAIVRLDGGGPALFRQRRGGLGGEPFVIYKFRTMRVVEDGAAIRQACRNDARCTAVGRVLRRLSLDELPQLINVLKGEMSLVGPRPHALAHDAQFQSQLPLYSYRFMVRPGITGLAQVSGWRGEARTPAEIFHRLEKDLEYVRTWSFWGDVKILCATLKCPTDPRAY
jgi:lipopolysaccharide/colanic/teichoic acid biosynthesis glycosyltransferase